MSPVQCQCEGITKIYYVEEGTPCVIFAFSNEGSATATWKKIQEAKKLTNLYAGDHEMAQAQSWTIDVLRYDSYPKGEKFTWGVLAKSGPYGVIVSTKTVEELIHRIFANINNKNVSPRQIDVVKVDSTQLDRKQ
jgi:hypothetical protein